MKGYSIARLSYFFLSQDVLGYTWIPNLLLEHHLNYSHTQSSTNKVCLLIQWIIISTRRYTWLWQQYHWSGTHLMIDPCRTTTLTWVSYDIYFPVSLSLYDEQYFSSYSIGRSSPTMSVIEFPWTLFTQGTSNDTCDIDRFFLSPVYLRRPRSNKIRSNRSKFFPSYQLSVSSSKIRSWPNERFQQRPCSVLDDSWRQRRRAKGEIKLSPRLKSKLLSVRRANED